MMDCGIAMLNHFLPVPWMSGLLFHYRVVDVLLVYSEEVKNEDAEEEEKEEKHVRVPGKRPTTHYYHPQLKSWENDN